MNRRLAPAQLQAANGIARGEVLLECVPCRSPLAA